MAPTDSASWCQTKDETLSNNANPTTALIPSHLDSVSSPQAKASKHDHSYLNGPPSGLVTERSEPQQIRISQTLLQGLHLLGLDMPEGVAAKVATTYTNMLPMERFLAETCNVDAGAHVQDVVGSSKTSSCQANAGSFKSE